MTTGIFFIQVFGFLLQTYPIAILSFVSFSQEELLFPRKKLYLCLFFGMSLISFCFAIISSQYVLPSQTDAMALVSNAYMMGFILLYTAVFFFVLRTDTLKKILVLVLLIHYAAILYIIVSSFAGITTPETVPYDVIPLVYSGQDVLISLALVIFTTPMVYLFLQRVVRPCLPFMENRILRRGCLYLLASLFLFCVCVFSLSSFFYFHGISDSAAFFFLLTFILTDVIIYFMFFTEARLFQINQKLEDQLRSFDENYRKISANIAEARRARHDLRHHLNIISTLHQNKKDAELTEYLQRYKVFTEKMDQTFLSGYPALDDLLGFYIQHAREEDILVDANIQPIHKNLGFDIIDLTVLIGNIMENAMDACRLVSQKPYIRIWLRLSESALLMKIENSCLTDGNTNQDYTDGREFLSTKHTSMHGQGLKSIRHVTEKYGGSAEFRKNDGVFSVRIVLNIP